MKSLLPFSPIFQMYFIKRKKTERPTSPSWQATGGRSPGCRHTAWTGWTSKESPGRPLLEQRRSSRLSHEQDPPTEGRAVVQSPACLPALTTSTRFWCPSAGSVPSPWRQRQAPSPLLSFTSSRPGGFLHLS